MNMARLQVMILTAWACGSTHAWTGIAPRTATYNSAIRREVRLYEAVSDQDSPNASGANSEEADNSGASVLMESQPQATETEPMELHEEEQFPLAFMEEIDEKQLALEEDYMRMAIEFAQSGGGEKSLTSAYPSPTVGAVLVAKDGTVMGMGRSDFNSEAVRACLKDAGLEITPLSEWCVSWPSSPTLREQLTTSTLYVTLEPSAERRGTAFPPTTQLITQTTIPRIVIGSPSPIPEQANKAAEILHNAGMAVSMGQVCAEECKELIEVYSELVNSKFQTMARSHFKQTGRPLGFLHCSVVDTDNLEAFARNGNAFGTDFGGTTLGFRNFGTYEIAPPPEVIWADNGQEDDDDELWDVDFEDEDFQDELEGNPTMPWYEQVDAVCATFPKAGNGPADDDSVTARLNGLKWLATHGETLPAGVERILVMDATDLESLPLTNDNPNLPKGVDVEHFWKSSFRKPSRVLLRMGAHAQARTAALAAAAAAKSAAEAAQRAADAVEMGDAASATEVALECQKDAEASRDLILKELERTQSIKTKLESMGVIVETLEGKEPIDVMHHLGQRSGYKSVLWRGGCWQNRGVQAILAGAFQWVSAHLAVDAVGGKFWQLMLAENAVQAACGPERKVKVFADQEDLSIEYCDAPDVDQDCTTSLDGRPVRHIRLDCRVALFDEDRPREFVLAKTEKLNKRTIEEQAPWFL